MLRTLYQRLGLLLLIVSAALLTVASASAANAAASSCAVTFKVHVPAKTSGTVYLSGNIPALGPWSANKLAMTGTGATRTAVVSIPKGTKLQFKFTRGDWKTVEVNSSGKDISNRTYTVPSAAKATFTGTIPMWHDQAGQ